jgi:hypothetical protein
VLNAGRPRTAFVAGALRSTQTEKTKDQHG